jgi:hypothetical protein
MPHIEGLSMDQVTDVLGQPVYVLDGRGEGVTTWFYEIDRKAVKVFFFEGKASLIRQK